ncbi:putative holin-like toxin [Planomicrobium sp. YIM 101495]|nr:putative holin-like toxin [Planomicrobium sp. YIM 101495]
MTVFQALTLMLSFSGLMVSIIMLSYTFTKKK